MALGPAAVISQNYGLITGRASSLALDPSDPTGNTLYVGTTGGGVWQAQNAGAANAANVVFTPLTDAPGALSNAVDASISIGAITVQPGGTGVILAGTGDPNDALDSYYGAGILRSTDSGKTWSLIAKSQDWQMGLSNQDYGFSGEGFAGFAWSSVNPRLVVAAVSQSAEGQLVDAEVDGTSYKGLYYSPDSGATWLLARITDGNGHDVQGPLDGYSAGNGNAVTAVVWNQVRGVFMAAVRFHGYYQSADGVTWTRLNSQPGLGLSSAMCPTNPMIAGSPACPVFRGALAVNPLTGDTFAWTVDENNQDQGIWQDVCAASRGACTNTLSFSKKWNTAPLEADTSLGKSTIVNGDYDLVLSAVPSDQDTVLLAGDNDLWKCSLAMGCVWRNTTNSATCMSAQVGPFQHALEWSGTNPLELFVGNDSGLWRSLDAIGETDSTCSAADGSHWQNLNGGIGSLAEVESMSAVGMTPYTMMAGMGANGTAGVKNTTGVTLNWPEMIGGEGGPVAIDPTNADKWYANNGAGISIHLCSKAGQCTPSDFGAAPIVTNGDVGNDGLTMTRPAPFLVDPLDATQLLIGTCRLWRGPANGDGWTASNVVTAMLDGNMGDASCSGNAMIRTMAAMALPGGGEIVYVGVYGRADGGATVAGHVLKAAMNADGTWSAWQDLALSPVSGDLNPMNVYGLDVSSVTVDSHDVSGNTVYITVAGVSDPTRPVAAIYRSTDGGAHWQVIDSNLPWAPVNAAVVDPADANTLYLATDVGVFSTRTVAICGTVGGNCWAPYGARLPLAPVVALSTTPIGVTPGVLVAGTYGRGMWQIPLLTNASRLTTARISTKNLTFGTQTAGTTSPAQIITITNTGASPLAPTAVTATGDFGVTDNCAQASIATGATCSIQVSFSPAGDGVRSGQLTVAANVSGGSLTVSLLGMGATTGNVQLSPGRIDFGQQLVGATSQAFPVTVANIGGTAITISSITSSGPFQLKTNSCGTTSLPANSDCVFMIVFQPTENGPVTGTLTMVDDAGMQYVQLLGTGTSPPTDTLSIQTLSYPATIVGQNSEPQIVSITNNGTNPLTSIEVSIAGEFIQANNCTTQLASQSSCSISIQFSPTRQGPQTGSLTVADALKTQTVTLAGTGLLAPLFRVSPSNLSFTTQQVGAASVPSLLSVTNAGDASMANVGFQITGPAAASFSTGATTCGPTLAAGANCSVSIVFTPQAAGSATATLTLTSSTLGVKSVAVPLSGTGQSPSALSASPSKLSFAPTAIGDSSPAQSVLITNAGGSTASGLTIVVSGPFSLSQNVCGTGLPAGSGCSVGVIFAPMQSGTLTGTLTIHSSSVPTPTIVALSGIGGLNGAIQLQPALVTFPITGVGITSSAISVTVSNTSTAVSLDNMAFSASAGFKLSAGTCATSLAPGTNCTVDVAFVPASPGGQTGNLTIASSTLGGNAAVPLSGIGFDFAVVQSGASSKTVASGQTASYSVTLTPSGGAATFTFQCNSLPSYAACVFNPSANSVATSATGTEIVQITTSQAAAMASPQPPGPHWKATSLALGFLLLPFATRKRRRQIGAIVLLTLAIAGLSSCASSGGGGGGSTPTPTAHTVAPGTYAISLIVTSNSVQHAVSLTMVVD